VAYKFTGTPLVTGLMLLATTYLLVWDLRSLQFLVLDDVQPVRLSLPVIQSPYWMWLGLLMFITIISFAVLSPNIFIELGVPFIEGLIAFILFFTVGKKFRTSQINPV
jgi:hypothetical protein